MDSKKERNKAFEIALSILNANIYDLMRERDRSNMLIGTILAACVDILKDNKKFIIDNVSDVVDTFESKLGEDEDD